MSPEYETVNWSPTNPEREGPLTETDEPEEREDSGRQHTRGEEPEASVGEQDFHQGSFDDPVGHLSDGYAPEGYAREVLERIQRESSDHSAGMSGEGSFADDAGEADEQQAITDAARELFEQYWKIALAAVVGLFALIVLVTLVVGGGGGGEEAATPADQQPSAAVEQPVDPRETNIVFEAPADRDGSVYLKAGEIAWKGKLEATDSGELLTLEGATAAQFKRSVALPGGSITTGVFGRASPEQPVLHATFQRAAVGEAERTSGTYYAVRDGSVLVEGSYRDEREGESVARTYREDTNPRTDPGIDTTYSIRFEAPKGTPIPLLVGWQAPGGEQQSEGEGGEG